MRYFLIILLVIVTPAAFANPCDRIDRSLGESRKAELAITIAKEQHVAKIDVMQSFRSGGWSIIYVANVVLDEPFFFYAGNPLTTKPVMAWSGAAAKFEEQDIKEWVLKNAPGIPKRLANCFAWHVTKDRDQ